MNAVANAVQVLLATLRKDWRVSESTYISMITFANDARQIVPLTEVARFQLPELIPRGGGTALGAALKKVVECADRDTKEKKGDWRPIVFIMTDGEEISDNIESSIQTFKESKWGIVVCFTGSQTDQTFFRQITEYIVELEAINEEMIARLFGGPGWRFPVSREEYENECNLGACELPPPPTSFEFV